MHTHSAASLENKIVDIVELYPADSCPPGQLSWLGPPPLLGRSYRLVADSLLN